MLFAPFHQSSVHLVDTRFDTSDTSDSLAQTGSLHRGDIGLPSISDCELTSWSGGTVARHYGMLSVL